MSSIRQRRTCRTGGAPRGGRAASSWAASPTASGAAAGGLGYWLGSRSVLTRISRSILTRISRLILTRISASILTRISRSAGVRCGRHAVAAAILYIRVGCRTRILIRMLTRISGGRRRPVRPPSSISESDVRLGYSFRPVRPPPPSSCTTLQIARTGLGNLQSDSDRPEPSRPALTRSRSIPGRRSTRAQSESAGRPPGQGSRRGRRRAFTRAIVRVIIRVIIRLGYLRTRIYSESDSDMLGWLPEIDSDISGGAAGAGPDPPGT